MNKPKSEKKTKVIAKNTPIPELDALGVKYTMMYGTARARFVERVCIPWTPEQWVGVLHREGQWLSVCCGNISAIRDQLMQALADGGWIGMRELERVNHLMETHDGFDTWYEAGFVPTQETLDDPMYLLTRIWAVVKPLRWASWMDVPVNLTPEREKALLGRRLEEALSTYNTVQMFHVGEYTTPEGKAKAQFRHDREVTLAMQWVKSSLRAFTDQFKELSSGPGVHGMAIVRKDSRDEVVEGRGGPVIVGDVAAANECIAYWCTNDQEKAPKAEDFEVRPVYVSVDKGIEFV